MHHGACNGKGDAPRKGEWPHLLAITDPAVLREELDVVRTEYTTTRLHSGVGYVSPDDEHEGSGEAIRQARRDGLAQARDQRLAYNRITRKNDNTPEGPDVV